MSGLYDFKTKTVVNFQHLFLGEKVLILRQKLLLIFSIFSLEKKC